MKKVSIIVPTYNRASVIQETLNSVFSQTYQNWECIIIDDGSTDNTEEVVQYYLKNDCRFQFHKRIDSYKKGGNGARNYGFDLSVGDFIQYLDADDILSMDKIEKQINLATDENQADVFSCSLAYFSDNILNSKIHSQYIDKSYDKAEDWLRDSWSGGGFGQTMIWLTPRKVHMKAGRWNESVIKNQDGEFFCRVLLNARSLIYSNEGLVYYRKDGKKTSKSTYISPISAQSTFYTFQLYEKHTSELSDNDFSRAIANQYYKFIFFYFPHYRNLREDAISSIIRLGYKPVDFAQNRKIYFLTKFLGLEITLRIIHLAIRLGR